jgi:hypothetical protein
MLKTKKAKVTLAIQGIFPLIQKGGPIHSLQTGTDGWYAFDHVITGNPR